MIPTGEEVLGGFSCYPSASPIEAGSGEGRIQAAVGFPLSGREGGIKMGPPPHPFAGKTGEGPPLAPPNWKWRAGNRAVDMYFYSPTGRQFRSKTELASYLLTLVDPPDASTFLWRIPPELLESGYTPPAFEFVPKKRSPKRKAQVSVREYKRVKSAPPLPQQRVQSDAAQPSSSTVSATESPKLVAGILQELNRPQGGTPKGGPPEQGRSHWQGGKKTKRAGIPVVRSFKSILAGRSSFKWLHDPETMEKFLEEARRLTFKSPAEIHELRRIVLERGLDMSNICKYSNSAIRVFVLLLRNEEAPASMGKGELADLCVTWRCKKRHYWCLLEVGRVKAPPTKFSTVAEARRGVEFGPNGRLVNRAERTDDPHGASDGGAGTQSSWRDIFGVGRPNPVSCPSHRSAAENLATSQTPSAQGQAQSGTSNSLGKESEASMPSGNRDNGIAGERRSDAPSGEFHSELHPRPETSASGLNGGVRLDHAAYMTGAADDSPSMVPRENEEQAQGLEGKNCGELMSSTECRPNSKHSRNSPTAGGGCPERMLESSMREIEEPAPSANSGSEPSAAGDQRRPAETAETLEDSDPRSSDLCGESIIVITGFKSKGVGNASQIHDTTHIKRGNCAVNGNPFAGFSDPTGWPRNGSRQGFTSRAETANALGFRKDGPDAASNSKCEGMFTGLCNSVDSDNARKTCGKGGNKFDSNCEVAMQSHDFDSLPRPGQGTVQKSQGGKSEMPPPPTLRDRSGISQEDVCETLFASKGMGRRLLSDLMMTPNEVAYVRDASFRSKNHALVKSSTSRNGAFVPRDECGSLTLEDKRPGVSLPNGLIGLWDAGSRKEPRTCYTREEITPSAVRHFGVGRGNFVCWCRICGSDYSFCRGCMCSFCKKALQHGEDWTVVKCICDHVCHIDCAIASNAAGVVKELGLDGELSCPSCARKVDLWPFFLKRFDLILSLTEVAHVNLKGLEKLLLQAVKLLKGSEKNRYKSLEDLVVESYELTRKFPVLVLIQQLVRTIRDELCMARSDSGLVEGELNPRALPGQIDALKERLAKESLDKAKSERLLMETTIGNVQRAYEDALNKRTQARSALQSKIDNPHTTKDKADSPAPKELIVSQQAKVDLELKTLWDMRKLETVDSLTVTTLDNSTLVWLEQLKSQRGVVEKARIELKRLETSNNHSN